jgi:hypothetical protein
MVTLKRYVYCQPFIKFYRDQRAQRIASDERPTRHGFLFAGHQFFFRDDREAAERSIVQNLFPRTDVFVDVGASRSALSNFLFLDPAHHDPVRGTA